MTHVFDLQLHKVQIPTEMREWNERFPVGGAPGERAMRAIWAWRDGKGPNDAEDMPRVLLAERPRKSWPAAFTTDNGLYVVSEGAKDVIEQLDPGIHQFFPLKLQTKRGIDIPGPWYAMNVHVNQDSVLVERSRVFVDKDAPDRLCSFYGSSKSEDVVVDPARQSGLHLWREARFMGSLLASDELIDEFKARGIRFFPSFRATDVTDITMH